MFHCGAIDLKNLDPELCDALRKEGLRQEETIELIASENYASLAVMAAQGSCFTNKYAEGYPGRRYYSGCEHVDRVEQLAIERAKTLFGARYANVQPHSGSQANAAVYLALLNPGDTLMGLDLSCGGHLTHGFPVSSSGKYYRSVPYGVDDNGHLDYDAIQRTALECRPKLIISGFSAYSQPVDWKRFRTIADEVGAYLLADIAHIAGPVAAGLLPSPVPHAHVVTCTTHKTLAGPRGGLILSGVEDPLLHRKLDSAVFPGIQGGPLPHVIAGKAVAFLEALQPAFKTYQSRVLCNARVLARELSQLEGARVVSGGTQNHLLVLDLTDLEISGREAERRLYLGKLALNKNTIPRDPRGPVETSGIRMGSPAITRRGMGESETVQIAQWIRKILQANRNLEAVVAQIRPEVQALCQRFPVYPALKGSI